jgi:hypothetical protein
MRWFIVRRAEDWYYLIGTDGKSMVGGTVSASVGQRIYERAESQDGKGVAMALAGMDVLKCSTEDRLALSSVFGGSDPATCKHKGKWARIDHLTGVHLPEEAP